MSWISKNRQDSKIFGAIQPAREDVRPGNANQ